MKIYYMPHAVYHDIWHIIETYRKRELDYTVIDRFLCYTYKLKALSDEQDFVHGGYPFQVNDEKMYVMFLLKWT